MKQIILMLSARVLICTQANAQWNVVDVGTATGLFSVCFFNKDTGFICGINVFLQSFDGGNSWAPVPDVNAFGHALYAMDFPTSKVGYVAGTFIVLKTEDGGLTWSDITPPNADYLHDVQFLNKDTGVVSEDGKFFKTSDGGMNWQEIHPEVAFGASFEYIQFLDADTAYLCSHDIGSPFAALLKSTDEGLNWNYAFTQTFWAPDFLPYKVFQFLNADTGYAGVGGGVYKTLSGGNSWSLCPYQSSCANIFFLSTDTGFVVGSDSNLTTAVYKTFDGGDTWSRTITPYPDSNYYVIEMFFLNKDEGYAVGSNGLFMKTDNGGGFLTVQEPSNDFDLSAFPNPTFDHFTIQFANNISGNVRIVLSNVIGETLSSQTLSSIIAKQQIQFDVSDFTAGIYFITIHAENETHALKIVKQ